MNTTIKEDYLITYDGRKIALNDLTNQHLSNVIHYCKTIGISPVYLIYADKIESLLQQKLNGKLLPYMPPVDNWQEMVELKNKNLLKVEEKTILIVKDRNCLGEVVNNNFDKFEHLLNALL